MRSCVAMLVLVTAAAWNGWARHGLAQQYVPLSQCVVTLIDEVEVPARQAGVLTSLQLADGTRLREGMRVKRGELLGKLDDADALARRKAAELDHRVAMAEAEKGKASIEAAVATVKVAEAEVIESESINEAAPGSIPPTQLRRQRLTEDRARTEAEVARRDAETAALTVELRAAQIELASINLDHHKIVSPLDGEVHQIYKHAGEWVTAGDPILRIVHLDRLRVEGFVNINAYLPQDVDGRKVLIQVQLKERTETFESVINHVSHLVEANGDYRVWAEVDNREVQGHPVLLPGMTADMRIVLE